MSRGKDAANFARGMAFISPWLIGFAAFTAIPIVLSLYYSFCEYSLLQSPVWIGLGNYQELWHDALFWRSLWNTVYYAVLALPVGLAVSLGLAILLNRPVRGQAIYRTIIFLPSLVPVVASAMVWMWLFNQKLGLINQLLGTVGIDGPGWLSDGHWAMPSLALMSLWSVGNTVIIFLAGLQDVPQSLYEAAEIDGVNSWQRLWNVTIPTISPVIFFNLIMAIIGTWQVFTVPYIMTGGGADYSTLFYSMYLYNNAFVYLRMGYAGAMAWIQLLIIMGLTGLAFWSARRWVHY
jgi:multiple sugar transport system permease protein